MKNIFGFLMIWAMALGLSAQDCEQFLPYEEGQEIVKVSYDKKDKPTGYSTMEVVEIDGNEYVFKIKGYDDKGKSTAEMDYSMECAGNVIYIDMDIYLPEEQMASIENMDVEVEGDPLELPSSLEVGQELASGTITAKAKVNGSTMMTISVEITNRRVTGMETVSTSVGDFECYVIEQDIQSNMGIIKVKSSTKEYWSPGNGHIKSVSYKSNGKMMGYEVLGQPSDIE